MSTSTPVSTPASITHRLDAEWQHLTGSSATAEALARWRDLEPVLAGSPDLEALRRAVHDRTDLDTSDQLLAALTRLAAVSGHGDPLAARVLLQLLIPGAVRLAQRLATMVGDQATSEAVVFAELTILIRTYPWQRRPRRIAANLLLDCRQRLTRSHHRVRPEVCAGLTLHDPAAAAEDHHGHLDLHDLLWWARRQGILNKLEAQLLVASHVADIPMHQLASTLGRSRSTLFTIRAAAEQRLRHALTSRHSGRHPTGQRTSATGRKARTTRPTGPSGSRARVSDRASR